MTRAEALAVFEKLDRARTPNESAVDEDDIAAVPTYSVRLDATYDVATEQREYRVRVTPGPWDTARDGWLYVMEVAGEHDLSVDIQNAGVELR